MGRPPYPPPGAKRPEGIAGRDQSCDEEGGYRRYICAPHIRNSHLPLEELEQIIASMKADGATSVKLGGEAVFIWEEGERPAENPAEKLGRARIDFSSGGVRPVKLCLAESACERFQRPVYDLAAKLDERYFGPTMEAKVVIGVAGCQRSCSEPAIKDIGIIAEPEGYRILVGGAAGLRPRIAEEWGLLKTEEEVIELVGHLVAYVRQHGKRLLRLGGLIEKRGMDDLRSFVEERERI